MGLKEHVLLASKHTGGFRLSRKFGPKGLQILCYHGFSVDDEHLYEPGLFIRTQVFEKRLAWLQKTGFRVISLNDGLRKLDKQTISSKDIVITIDDGFVSVKELAAPILKFYGFPSTLYMTTYCMEHQEPIFVHAVRYAFWKTAVPTLDTADLFPGGVSQAPTKGSAADAHMWKLIEFGQEALGHVGRVELARAVCSRLDCDYEELQRSRRLSLLSSAEVSELHHYDIDVQLHTHRHRISTDIVRQEISDNRFALTDIVPGPLEHFCYPSGVWSTEMWPELDNERVKSATTCDVGINTKNTPRLALKRFLDGDTVPQVTFEAHTSRFIAALRSFNLNLKKHLGYQRDRG